MVDQAANLRRLVIENRSIKRTKTIAITSGKGGVGKTSLAVGIAIALARSGSSVTLLDADLGLANINVILGIIPKYNLYHVIKGKKKLKDIVIEVPEGIKIIAGASGFHQLANLDIKQRNDFIEAVSELDEDDYMIIDTGAGISQNVLSFLNAADEVVVVTTPEPTAITDAYGIIKSIASQSPDKPVKLRAASVDGGDQQPRAPVRQGRRPLATLAVRAHHHHALGLAALEERQDGQTGGDRLAGAEVIRQQQQLLCQQRLECLELVRPQDLQHTAARSFERKHGLDQIGSKPVQPGVGIGVEWIGQLPRKRGRAVRAGDGRDGQHDSRRRRLGRGPRRFNQDRRLGDGLGQLLDAGRCRVRPG